MSERVSSFSSSSPFCRFEMSSVRDEIGGKRY